MAQVSSGRRVIRFKTREAEVKGFYTLIRAKMPVHDAGEHRYLISEKQCELLQDNKIEYEVERLL
jgi:hypothetical protein